jgi:hypothetical protein
VFDNRVLRRVFGHKGDGVTGGWRKFHNENQIKAHEMREACSTHRGNEKLYKTVVGKPEGKRTLGRLSQRWEDTVLKCILWK